MLEHFSFKTQLFVLYSLLVGGISIFILIYVPSVLEKQAFIEMVNKFQTLTEQTTLTVSPELVFSDKEEMENDLSGLKANPAVRYIVVTTAKGDIFTSYRMQTAIEAEYRLAVGNRLLPDGDELFTIMKPIYSEKTIVGYLYLGFSLSQLSEQVTTTRLEIAYACGFVFIVGVVVVYWISTVLTKPLRGMVDIAETIARGDLSKRAPKSRQPEIGHLAFAFNIMVDNLTTAQKDLLEINQTLEQRVYERTEKLFQEIKVREEAEQQLRVSDEILKRVPSLILVFDQSRMVTYVSPSITSILGYKPEHFLGHGWWSLLHPVLPEPVPSGNHEPGNSMIQLDHTYERLIFTREGESRWILWQDSKDLEEYTICVGHDITERKSAEQALLESEKRYRHLFEFNPIPGWVYDLETLFFLTVNDSAMKNYGYTNEEFLTMTLKDIRPEEDVPLLMENLNLSEQPVFQSSGPWRHRKKNGTIITVEISSHALTYMGRPCRLVLAKDITERIRYETQLRNLSQRLETVREEERTWIAREIHDQLGQSLTGLKMYINSIANAITLLTEHEVRQTIQERLSASTYLLDQTIRSVQAISTQLRPAILDRFGLIAALEWHTQEFQEQSGIRCELTTELDDSRLPQQYTITLFRIVQEALTNVARHAHARFVTILLVRDEEDIYLEIRDNGRGISEADISRPDALGIIGIRERVASLQGSITINGEPDKGTTLSIRLPFIMIDNS